MGMEGATVPARANEQPRDFDSLDDALDPIEAQFPGVRAWLYLLRGKIETLTKVANDAQRRVAELEREVAALKAAQGAAS